MKHTPGPWKDDEDSGAVFLSKRNREGLRYGVVQSSGELKPVAPMSELYWSDIENGSCEEVRANCRLVAAAPELLEACEQLIHEIEQNVLGIASGYSEHSIEKAAAAIRKAKGEE